MKGEQNIPAQNMPVCLKNHFKLVIFLKQYSLKKLIKSIRSCPFLRDTYMGNIPLSGGLSLSGPGRKA